MQGTNTENQLEILKAQQARLVFYLLIPGTILFAFLLFSASTLTQLIAPLSVEMVMIVLCVIDMTIAIPLVIKLNNIKKQILNLSEDKC